MWIGNLALPHWVCKRRKIILQLTDTISSSIMIVILFSPRGSDIKLIKYLR